MKRLFAFIMLIFVVSLCGCQGEPTATNDGEKVFSNGDVIGKGDKEFEFSVKYENGESEKCTVKTDSKTVGEALLENGIITGEDGKYGLYVKTVNGVLADFDKTGTYWAFYINGEYANSGVDTTEIKSGEKYSLEVEK